MPTPEPDPRFMQAAIDLAVAGVEAGDGGPFGAVVVRDGRIVGRGHNRVTSSNDPTAHAEVVAIREACEAVGSFSLAGCELYTSCEPCPMCLGAIAWARLDRVFYAGTRQDAAAAGFDDAEFYDEIARPIGERRLPMVAFGRDEAVRAFDAWRAKDDRVDY